ncbi:MAG: hypothetical protein LBV47_03275 [Bacteroidales bacterium]|nr:hypothetical protein [Bacteroidales bacterium]
METKNVFISVGLPATKEQEDFVVAVEDRLRSEGLIPNTVGRNKFSINSPLKTIDELMDNCCGVIIIALERTYFPEGIEKRGSLKESVLKETKYPTPWNQIESAMAYTKKLPLMVILEEGLKSEGLLEKGHDWYVLSLKPVKESLLTPVFNGLLSSWKQKIELYKKQEPKNKIDPATLTIGELFRSLKVSHFWSILAALLALITGAFAFGKFLEH